MITFQTVLMELGFIISAIVALHTYWRFNRAHLRDFYDVALASVGMVLFIIFIAAAIIFPIALLILTHILI